MRKVGRVYLSRLLLILITGFSLHIHCFAQPWPNDPDGGTPSDQNDFGTDDPGDPIDGDPGHDPDVPIDTNILLIVGAVVIYGLKKAWDVKQRKKGRMEPVANYEDFIK